MKNTKNKVEVINKGESTPDIGANMRFFRKKKKQKEGKPNQTEFATILKQAFLALDPSKLSEEYKAEYTQLKDKEITQQVVSGWEIGEVETPKLIAYLAAQYFNIGVEWLTDYVFEIFEGSNFVQTGGVSYNNLNSIHTQSIQIQNDPEPIVEGFKSLMQVQKEFYEERLRREDK